MVWFRELISDDEFSVELRRPDTGLYLRVITAEDVGSPFLADKILIDVRHLTFRLHPKHIDHVRLKSIKHLRARGSPNRSDIRKVHVGGHCLSKTTAIQMGKARFDVASHRESKDGSRQLIIGRTSEHTFPGYQTEFLQQNSTNAYGSQCDQRSRRPWEL
jgi:hypothetical protein